MYNSFSIAERWNKLGSDACCDRRGEAWPRYDFHPQGGVNKIPIIHIRIAVNGLIRRIPGPRTFLFPQTQEGTLQGT